MSDTIGLIDLVNSGWEVEAHEYYLNWSNRVSAYLSAAMGDDFEKAFAELASFTTNSNWEKSRASQIGHLEGLAARIGDVQSEAQLDRTTPTKPSVKPRIKDVFIVHGHDGEAQQAVARYVERLGLKAVILHEQPNSGRTIIEKFEVYSDVGFAVVLLTPDDIGAPKDSPDKQKARARQNVVLELGYFLGKLGRSRVCALYKSGVEMPSDYQGVVYTPLDEAGGWRTKLAQELVEAGFSIDLNAIIEA